MLDDMPIAEKAKLARKWFELARDGRMPFTEATAKTFDQVLEAIEIDANLLQANLNIAQARLTLLDIEAARSRPELAEVAALAATPAGNVVRLQLPRR